MAGLLPQGPTLVFDDDHYYMGSVVAEYLRKQGLPVTLITQADSIFAWSKNTYECGRAQKRLLELNVEIITGHELRTFDGSEAQLACAHTGRDRKIIVESVVMVGQRKPNDQLYQDLHTRVKGGAEGAPITLTRIGDCLAPAIIASAVYGGHRYARELDTNLDADNPLRHDRIFSEAIA